MNFDISHSIAGLDVAQYEQLYFDEPFNEALCAALGLTRKLIRLHTSQSTIVREVEVVPKREIPAAVRKLLGGKDLAYTETISYTLGSGRGTWSTVSSVLPDKIKSDGELHILGAPNNSVQRRVVGHVTVRIFGLGKLIENFIVTDVTDGYVRAAQFTERYLATHKGR